MSRQRTLGQVAYALVFTVAAPLLLIQWARAAPDVVTLPAIHRPVGGMLLLAAGALMLVSGMWSLMRFGRGLPMNAYPPPIYVVRGVYRLTPHPIYVGFVGMSVGASLAAGSSGGLWLVSPMVALALTALVLGYERHDLRRRFGDSTVVGRLVALPPDRTETPTLWNRLSLYPLVFLPWGLAYQATLWLGVPPDAVPGYLPFEHDWPVLEWTEVVYGSTYLFAMLVPFGLRTQRDLRAFAVSALVSTGVVTLIYVVVPVIAPTREFVPETLLGRLLIAERAFSSSAAAFPAFHVLWAMFAARAWATLSRRVGAFAWIWAVLIAISCITTGMHALVDIVFAVAIYAPLANPARVWEWLRRNTERVANSWHEWQAGPVRLLNHGFYAGFGGGGGLFVAAWIAGSSAFWGMVLVGMSALLGAGLWAQKLEGSSLLSRPFGFYGSVFGGIGGALLAGTMGYDLISLLTGLAIASPWVQAVGRLRCLVQGCCHGATAPEGVGIRYWHPKSRVCHLAHLKGQPLHPTPLYSILSNLVVGVLLVRLWTLDASPLVIVGLYLMFNGVSRFVEESYRGEPQTPVLGGLRLYQWLAILSAISGAVITSLPSAAVLAEPASVDFRLTAAAVSFGLLALFAMGVDFPRSNRRFARLAS